MTRLVACAMASRRLPGPLSSQLCTTISGGGLPSGERRCCDLSACVGEDCSHKGDSQDRSCARASPACEHSGARPTQSANARHVCSGRRCGRCHVFEGRIEVSAKSLLLVTPIQAPKQTSLRVMPVAAGGSQLVLMRHTAEPVVELGWSARTARWNGIAARERRRSSPRVVPRSQCEVVERIDGSPPGSSGSRTSLGCPYRGSRSPHIDGSAVALASGV